MAITNVSAATMQVLHFVLVILLLRDCIDNVQANTFHLVLKASSRGTFDWLNDKMCILTIYVYSADLEQCEAYDSSGGTASNGAHGRAHSGQLSR